MLNVALLLAQYQDVDVWYLDGQPGAGKTTAVQQLCRSMGVEGPVQSPTFGLVHEYRAADGSTINHLDFYRLRSAREALEAGLEDYLYSGRRSFIEWGNLFPQLRADRYIQIEIEVRPDGERQYLITPHL